MPCGCEHQLAQPIWCLSDLGLANPVPSWRWRHDDKLAVRKPFNAAICAELARTTADYMAEVEVATVAWRLRCERRWQRSQLRKHSEAIPLPDTLGSRGTFPVH